MQTSRLLSSSSDSPSLGSFSSDVDFAAIAARVVEEFSDRELEFDSHLDDGGFEFAFDCPSQRCSQPIATADEIFSNGKIRPLNPYDGGIRNTGGDHKEESQPTPNSTLPRRHRPALRKLFSEERDPTSNSSSEAEDDLAGVPPESYCVWTPKHSNRLGDSGHNDLQRLSSSPSQSKIKSNSASFSKRWKLRKLLYARSTSEGNEKLVFPVPIKQTDETISVQREEEEEGNCGEEEKGREETKRQSYVPYRKDMIGILKNVNGLSRHLHPF